MVSGKEERRERSWAVASVYRALVKSVGTSR
jgi:hypothetical protein